MRYGISLDPAKPIEEVIAQIRQVHEDGFAFVACSQIFSHDTLTLFAVAGSQVPDVELHTAVVPTYPRHPIVLAGQALTVQAATGGRLVLGIGLSHRIVIEGVYGYSFDRPARHMREYLQALMPLLHGEKPEVKGETLQATPMSALQVDAPAPPVLVAALGETMLKLTGRLADGTVTWMVGPATLDEHIVPTITAAASAAGRPAPRVEVGLPICVTTDVDAARERAARSFAIYGQLPSYRSMLDREGAGGPGDVAIVGDEAAVTAQLQRIADAGATEFAGAVFGSREERARTTALLRELAAA